MRRNFPFSIGKSVPFPATIQHLTGSYYSSIICNNSFNGGNYESIFFLILSLFTFSKAMASSELKAIFMCKTLGPDGKEINGFMRRYIFQDQNSPNRYLVSTPLGLLTDAVVKQNWDAESLVIEHDGLMGSEARLIIDFKDSEEGQVNYSGTLIQKEKADLACVNLAPFKSLPNSIISHGMAMVQCLPKGGKDLDKLITFYRGKKMAGFLHIEQDLFPANFEIVLPENPGEPGKAVLNFSVKQSKASLTIDFSKKNGEGDGASFDSVLKIAKGLKLFECTIN